MATTALEIPLRQANDLLTGAEWSPAHSRELLALTSDIKSNPERYAETLRGKFLALIFEKPSLRTRVTFEVGIQSMGGHVVFLDHTQARLGERESIADVARGHAVAVLLFVAQEHVLIWVQAADVGKDDVFLAGKGAQGMARDIDGFVFILDAAALRPADIVVLDAIRPVILRDDKFEDLKYLSARDAHAAELPRDYPMGEPIPMR